MATGFLPEFTTIQQGVGVPTHQAQNGTHYLDRATGLQYYNTTGGTTWLRMGVGSGTAAANVLTAATVLTAADSGKVFMLAAVGGFDVTLPANASPGFSCRFIVAVAPTTAYTVTAATADTMAGIVLTSATGAADVESAFSGDVANFVASTAVIGDQLDVYIDGTYGVSVRGYCAVAGGITITG